MSLLQRSGAWVRNLRGWRRAGLAFAAGAVSALGFAPLEFFPVLLLGFAVLLLLLDGADESPHPVRAGALSGWAFAFGQYLIGWHWIGYAFLVDPSAHLWQMPFALLFLTAGLALWAGIACGLALYFWQDGAARLLVFAIFYAGCEWVRGHALTGFPWNLQAYGWGASLAILQSTSVIGAYGLSFLTILFGASLADFIAPPFPSLGRGPATGSHTAATNSPTSALARARGKGPTDARGKLPVAPILMLLLFASLWGLGVWRLAQNPTTNVENVRLRVVQPDVPQREKEDSAYFARNWQRLLDLSQRPGAPTHIIWPEAATPPLIFDRSAYALDEIAVLTGADRALIAGATHFQRPPAPDEKTLYFNSLYIFGGSGQRLALYNKFHLVPFGEYVPFAQILNRIGITKLTAGQEGFATGDGIHTFQVPGAPPATPLICYEIIFPAAVTDHQQRPGWFINVTDDSWFGPWAGPYQHLLIARVRAIEEAIPVVRAANTGISAVIDPTGRLTAQLGLGKMGIIDARLPRALASSTYARFGDLLFLFMLISAAVVAWIIRRN